MPNIQFNPFDTNTKSSWRFKNTTTNITVYVVMMKHFLNIWSIDSELVKNEQMTINIVTITRPHRVNTLDFLHYTMDLLSM